MFDLGWTELLVVAGVAILVVGPKDLPGMLRTFGQTLASVKRMAGDFQRQFNTALEDAELDQLNAEIRKAQSIDPLAHLKKDLIEPVEPTPASAAKTSETSQSDDTPAESKAEEAVAGPVLTSDSEVAEAVPSKTSISDPGPAGDPDVSDDWTKRLDTALSKPLSESKPTPDDGAGEHKA